ncbi:MAG: hypothetical protein JXR50_12780 [Prolixibacteraceae bacterium]|nr:hypothetical protein [Prolixibacteraceae bacterium]
MKKLGKLSINQSKLLENEELVNLRGGYGGYGAGIAVCQCRDDSGIIILTDTFDAGCSCDYQKLDRWVETHCWPQHQPFSGCECDPCV